MRLARILKISLLSLVVLLTSCDELTMAQLRKQYGRSLPGDAEILARAARTPGQTSDAAPTETVPDLASRETDTCSQLIEGPPRGLACLHCNQPEARGQAKILSLLLRRSCLRNIAINYLVDGTFSFDEAFLFEEVEKLTANGRRLFLYFYITNGPSQRSWESTPINAFGVRMSPGEFRYRIQTDPQMQFEYQALTNRLIPVIRYALSRGAVVFLIPALEDNLSNTAFEAMLELALDVVPPDLPVAFGRNPCPNCFSGNEGGVPDGLFLDVHHSSPFISSRDGLVTNDGTDYLYVPNGGGNGVLTLDDLKPIRDSSARTNNVFILWNAKRQGFPGIGDDDRTVKHPSERTYQIPSFAEREAIIEFLRGN